jgi:hypothetical protein
VFKMAAILKDIAAFFMLSFDQISRSDSYAGSAPSLCSPRVRDNQQLARLWAWLIGW